MHASDVVYHYRHYPNAGNKLYITSYRYNNIYFIARMNAFKKSTYILLSITIKSVTERSGICQLSMLDDSNWVTDYILAICLLNSHNYHPNIVHRSTIYLSIPFPMK